MEIFGHHVAPGVLDVQVQMAVQSVVARQVGQALVQRRLVVTHENDMLLSTRRQDCSFQTGNLDVFQSARTIAILNMDRHQQVIANGGKLVVAKWMSAHCF